MTHDDTIATGRKSSTTAFRPHAFFVLMVITAFLTACSQIERPKTEPFYSQTQPPPQQEFRWSNGRLPRTIDPARASAPSENDVVRAIYEGLTDLDPRTLKEVPAVAEKWESTPDLKTWTFHLRKDSRWSNSDPVVADDFVRSWKRLIDLRADASNKALFENIVGMKDPTPASTPKPEETTDFLRDLPTSPLPLQRMQAAPNSAVAPSPAPHESPTPKPQAQSTKSESPKFGVEAVDDRTLRVQLTLPDKDFPKLVANAIFRPIYGDGAELQSPELDESTISNGAFRISSITDSSISLERSDTYWDRKSVNLERVRMVPTETAEKALEAYKAGSVDVVSNAEFEPLASKLLTPFEDFRKTTHSALNFYEINPRSIPFHDRRVREALAISIDRERINDAELDGATQPAYSFLPLSDVKDSPLFLDIERAKDLLAKAGYPNGQNFPQIRLVVNRNDTQQRVARTVAKMWRQNLNLDTLVIVKETSEMEKTRQSGDFDLIRRGVVVPTADELVGLSMMFDSAAVAGDHATSRKGTESAESTIAEKEPARDAVTPTGPAGDAKPNSAGGDQSASIVLPSEDGSLYDVYAIPLYFPTSYALVKPYVRGFDVNGLDAPSLKAVTIDNGWQP